MGTRASRAIGQHYVPNFFSSATRASCANWRDRPRAWALEPFGGSIRDGRSGKLLGVETQVKSPSDYFGSWPRPYKKGNLKAMSTTLRIRVDLSDLVLAAAIILHALMH